jgi:hypothetical protein
MEPNEDNGYERNYKTIMMRIEDGSTLVGQVNIGYRKRLSDIFRDPQEQFIILINARRRDNPETVIFVNKRSIMWAEPRE